MQIGRREVGANCEQSINAMLVRYEMMCTSVGRLSEMLNDETYGAVPAKDAFQVSVIDIEQEHTPRRHLVATVASKIDLSPSTIEDCDKLTEGFQF